MSDEARVAHEHGAQPYGTQHAHGAHADPDPELRSRPLVLILVVLAVSTIVAAVVCWPLVVAFVRAEPEPSRAVERLDRSRPAGPLLQVNPTIELEELRRQEERLLESYGWVDRGAGLARVPVERAAELVLAEGVGPITAPSPPTEAVPAAGAGREGPGDAP